MAEDSITPVEAQLASEEQETGKYKSGLTWRVSLAIVYSAIIIQPAALYLYFITNIWFIGAVLNTTIVLFAVLAKLSDNPLSQQEVFIMINVTSTSLGMELIVQMLFQYYLRHLPMTQDLGLTSIIPNWYAPDYFGPVRTLFTPVFILPLILFIFVALLAKAADISLGIVFNYLYTKVEVLPFPTAVVEAERAKSLTWEDKRKLQIFSVSAIIASLVAIVLYFFPLVFGVSLVPIPWFDLNPAVEGFLPGASFGIATDLILFATGFILPMTVIVSILIGSIFISVIGNPILVSSGNLPRWEKGLSLIDTFNLSQLDFWLGWTVGFLIAASLIPIVRNPKIFYRTIRDLRRLSKGDAPEGEGAPSLGILFSFFILGTLGSVAIAVFLIPNLEIRLIIVLILLAVGWTFLWSLTMSYAFGITANFPEIKFLKESAYVAAGTPVGSEIWFVPIVVSPGGASWAATFKTSDLTLTNRGSLIKAHILASFVAWFIGIFWVSALLSIAEVPSVIYPVPLWPLEAGRIITFVSNPTSIINPMIILISTIIALILYGIEWSVGYISVISLAVGTITPLPFAVTTFFGGLFAQILKRRMSNWNVDRAIIVAGIGAGIGIIISLATFIALILNTIALPF